MRAVWLFLLGCGEPTSRSPTPSVPAEPSLPSHDEVLKRVGAHRFEARVHTRAWDGDALDQDREETIVMEVDAHGQYRLVHDIGRDFGKEVVFVDGVLYTRHRYGAFLRREDARTESTRLRQEAWGIWGTHWDVVMHGVERVEEGGRFTLRKAEHAKTPRARQASDQKWRESVVVESANGHVALASEVPIDAVLTVTYTFRKEGHRPRVQVEVSHRVTRTASIIRAPMDEKPTPVRRSAEDERRRLLGDLR